MFIKDSIKKYILLKVESGFFKPGDKVFSENALAIKFGCSRQSSRNALVDLVKDKVITPWQGKGYIVTDQRRATTLMPFGASKKITKAVTHELETLSPIVIKELDLKDKEYFAFIKEYYNDKRLLAAQIVVLNNVLENKDHKTYAGSVTNELIQQGYPILESNFDLKFFEPKELSKYRKDLGWDHDPIMIKIKSDARTTWISRSIRLVNKDLFELSFNRKKLYNY